MRQCVAEQQVAVFVMDAGHRDGQQRENGKPNADHGEKQKPEDENSSLSQLCKWPSDGVERIVAPPRRKHCKQNEQKRDAKKRAKFAGKLQHRVAARKIHFKEESSTETAGMTPEPLQDN